MFKWESFIPRRVVEIMESNLGSDHPKVSTALNNLARLLQATNRSTEAEPLMRRAVANLEASLGADHPLAQTARKNLEILLEEMGNPEV